MRFDDWFMVWIRATIAGPVPIVIAFMIGYASQGLGGAAQGPAGLFLIAPFFVYGILILFGGVFALIAVALFALISSATGEVYRGLGVLVGAMVAAAPLALWEAAPYGGTSTGDLLSIGACAAGGAFGAWVGLYPMRRYNWGARP